MRTKTSQIFRALLPCALLASALAVHGQNSPYFNAVTALNPVAYWPLQETTQPPATYVEPNVSTNASGPGALANIVWASEGTANLLPSFDPPGASGQSMFFEGANSSSFGIVPTTDNRVSMAPGQPFSLELWVYPKETGSYQGIMCQTGPLANPIPNGGENAGTYKAGWQLGQNYVPLEDGGSGTQSGPLFGWSFTVWNGTGNFGGAMALAPYMYNTNTWYHLTCVFDGVNARIYVNGVLASPPDACIPMPAGTSFAPDTWDPIEFGCSRGLAANLWTGNLGNVAMYNYALSVNQITNHYAASQGNYEQAVFADNPYMFWHMNGNLFFSPPSPNSFPTAANYGTGAASINNLDYNGAVGTNAVYQPGTVPGVAGPSYAGFGANSYACAFNGINGVVDVGYEAAMNPTTTSNFSVVGWFKNNPADNNGRINCLVSHSQSSWRVESSNGVVRFNPGLGTGNDVIAPLVSTNGVGYPLDNINDGNWHMFAATVTNTTGNNTVATIYLDAAVTNAITNTTTYTGKTTTNIWLGGAPDFPQLNTYLYNSSYNSNYVTTQQYYAGRLAHVAYFAKTLTPAQVQSLYNAAEPPPIIVTQPASVAGTVSGGGTNTFSVIASGASTLSYQWYFVSGGTTNALVDDTNHISGSGTATLTITNTVSAESGSYYVVVTNAYGTATSSAASLQISSPPVIVSQVGGGSITMYTGQYYTLSVTAVGTPLLTYQWYTNGVADTTAGLTSSYQINSVQAAGTYQCTVSNSFGSANSSLTSVTVQNLPTSLTSNPYSSAILALNPSAYWPMHESSPGVQGDIENNLGTLGSVGNAFYGDWHVNLAAISNYWEIFHNETGALAHDPDPATRFNRGQASYMIVPHISPSATITAPFTAEAWVFPTFNGNFQVFIGQGGAETLNGSTSVPGFYLSYSGPNITNSFELSIFPGTGNTRITAATQPLYPEGQWYHVVGTYDGTNLALYVNGTNQGTVGYATGSVNVGTMKPDTFSPISIGTGPWSANANAPGNPFMGVLDEVAVYNSVLSSNRITTHYNDALNGANGVYKADVLADNPLLYYRMDASTYTPPPSNTWTVLNNYGSNYMPGMYTPGTVPGGISAAGVTGLASTNAMPGNGMSAYAIAGIGPGNNPLGYTSFSYTALFRTYPNDGGARNWQSIMSANDADWRASVYGPTGKFVGHGGGDITSAITVNDGNWHQMVVTAQGNPSAGNMTNTIYVDGVVQGTSVTSSNTPSGKPGPLGLIGNEYGFGINDATGNDAAERCLAGGICEAAFFMNQVLSPATVSNLYLTAGVAPFFSLQPISSNINGGLNFTNTVAVGGSGSTFNLQWYKDGVALPGQTSATLVLNSVAASDSSQDYYCVVSNSYGVAVSSAAYLNVITVPLITASGPAPNITVMAGSTVHFSITATGAAPLTYYWSSNNIALPAVTGTAFAVSNITTSGSGPYSVTVSNTYGTAAVNWNITVVNPTYQFQQAVLALNPADYWLLNEPGNPGQPTNGAICIDYIGGNNGIYENTELGVAGYDSFDSSFGAGNYDTNTAAQFLAGGNSCAYGISNVDVSSPTQSSFTVQAWALATGELGLTAPGIVAKGLFNNEEFTMDCAGNTFRFEVRNAAGTAINANTSVPSSDGIWHFLVGVCDEVHGQVTLYIDGTNAGSAGIATNAGILTNDLAVPMSIGSRSSAGTYSPGAMDQQFVGDVADVALYKYALTASQIQNLYYTAGFAPVILQQPPATTNVTQGNTLTVPVGVNGTAPITYQWYDTGGALPGETNSTLVVTNDQAGDTYYLNATNIYGSTNSASVAVTVNTFPIVVNPQPASPINLLPGASIALSASATGTAPLHYFWQSNNVYIAGATNTSFTLSNVTTNTTSATFIASNSLGTASYTWSVVVQPPAGGFLPAALALHPIDYYMMNEPVGTTTCIDYIRGNNGVYENTTLGVSGYEAQDAPFTANYDTNTCAQFGETTSQNSCAVNISNIDFSTPTNANAEFTIQCWVQALQEISSSINTPGIVGKGLYNNEEFALDCGNHPGTVDDYRFSIRNAAGTAINANTIIPAGADNNWHFLVGVCDESNGVVNLYIDGTNAASTAIPSGAGLFSANATIPMMIGSRTSASPYNTNNMNEQFIGNIADVGIYNYALNSNQVMNEYIASGVAPSIAALPATVDCDYSGTLSIPSQVVGTAPLYYQWYSTNGGGTPVAGQTNGTLTIANDTTPNSYYLVVSNTYGTNTSSTAAVVIITAPTIVQDIFPSNATIIADSTLNLSVQVDGALPIHYSWLFNGQPVVNTSRISGANSNVLTISPVETSDAGSYQLYATNSDGITSSSISVIQVVTNLTFNNGGSGWASQAVVNGSLQWSGDSVQLTANLGNEATAVFYDLPVYVGGFEASFTYAVPSGPTSSADGATFCIQNDPRGLAAIGQGGGALAVNTIAPSVELELNIYSGNGIGGVGMSLDTDGNLGPVVSTAPVSINSGDTIDVDITYLNGLANVTLFDEASDAKYAAHASINVTNVVGSDFAYVGFTGADGASKSTQVVGNFSFISIVALTATTSGGNVTLTWPASTGGYSVEQTTSLSQPHWTTINQIPTIINGQNQIVIPAPNTPTFYQLTLTPQ